MIPYFYLALKENMSMDFIIGNNLKTTICGWFFSLLV